jgi:hypothetical protein
MNPTQLDAFYNASGIHANGLSFDIRLFVGGVAIILSVLILVGLVHHLNSDSASDKSMFGLGIFGLMFTLSMIFIYIA